MADFLSSCLIAVFVCTVGVSIAQETPAPTAVPPPDTASTTTQTSVSTTTPTIEEECSALNTTCGACVSHPKCLWCFQPQKCVPFPVGQILPHPDICALEKARWGLCQINFKALIIAMGVVGGSIVLLITCCCVYCCCCRGNARARKKYMADEAKVEQDRQSRQRRNEERRAERQTKLDDIRRKYGSYKSEETEGLMKDDTPYQKFEES